MKRYESIANEITGYIQSGLLGKGEKLPSIRQSSLAHSVSASTLFQAYYLLEARGLITARERSGYYVTGTKGLVIEQHSDVPEATQKEVQEVAVSELIFYILDSSRQRNVIPFGSAFPSPLLFPLDKLAKSMCSSIKAMDPWTTIQDLSPGDPELRRQIALRYMQDGINISKDDIVITSGALEGLNLCLAAVTQPGDTVLIECPCFYGALQAIERNGLRAIEVPNHSQSGLDIVAFEAAIKTHKPKVCWLMTTFQNPTGSLMSEAKKQQLVDILTTHQIPLIEDDVYGELYFGKRKPLPAKAYDKDGLVMHCSSFSKSMAPGYRVGWVAPGRFSKKIERIKLTTSLTASVPAQQAIASYLARGGYDRHLRELRHTLMISQIKFIEAINTYFPPGTRVSKPEGGYFVWVKLPHEIDAIELHKKALAGNISIAPGIMFSANPIYKNYLRLNYSHVHDHTIDTAIETLGRLLCT